MQLILGSLLSLCCFAAHAGPWPVKPVRIVVAYPPGGGIDILARQLADKLAAPWGQPVIVENKPGANTILAAELVAKAADGHTVLMTSEGTFSINPHMYAKLPYDPQRDFLPVTLLVLLQQLLVANPSLPANNLAELIALAKARPGSINYASYGSGSQPHLSGEMLKYKAAIDLVHVPYKGISLAVPAVMAESYPHARRMALEATEEPSPTLPEACPWTPEQMLDAEFWPESERPPDRRMGFTA